MPPLIWSPQALSDVKRLHQFLHEKDTQAAQRVIKAIRTGVKILAYQPEIGRCVDDMDTAFRERLIDFGSSGYTVLYRFDERKTIILAVRHQREAGYH